jgi:hypothetical protein
VYEQFILDAVYESARQGGVEVKPTIPDEVKPIIGRVNQ